MVYFKKLHKTFKLVLEKLAREEQMLNKIKIITPIRKYRGIFLPRKGAPNNPLCLGVSI